MNNQLPNLMYPDSALAKKIKTAPGSAVIWNIVIVASLVVIVCAIGGLAVFLFAPDLAILQNEYKPGDPTATPPGEEITDDHYLVGKVAYQAAQYQEVVLRMTEVINTNPQLAPAYWYRGMAYWYLGQNESAFNDMQQALALDPNYALAYADRGLVYSTLGNEAQARADWETALMLDPSLAKVHHNLAVHYYNLDDYPQALQEYGLALEIDPTRAYTWQDYANTWMKAGGLQECVDSASQAIDLKSDLWFSYFLRGTCYGFLEDYEPAIVDLTIYIQAAPDDACGWHNRATVYRLYGDAVRAESDYRRARVLEPC